jgi:uncharacterized protein (DUF488 family)
LAATWLPRSSKYRGSAGPKALGIEQRTTPFGVMTIGHSTRPIEEFLHLLQSHCVQRVVDVRSVPRSRHNPQFNLEQLPPSLHSAGMHYTHMPGLGGFRHARPDSVNLGWRNASFRGYADYMQTAEFEQHLEASIELAKKEKIAVMCAEAVPWRCHRSLIADALWVRGIEVREITSATDTRLHTLTPFAQVHGTHVFYLAETSPQAVTRLPRPGRHDRRSEADPH